MKKINGFISLIVLFYLLVRFLYGGIDGPCISIREICADYNSNIDVATSKYLGKYIILKGKISSNSINLSEKLIFKDIPHASWSFIILKNDESPGLLPGILAYNRVICFFPISEIEKLKKLKVGDNVKIRGIITGTCLKSIFFERCSIVD